MITIKVPEPLAEIVIGTTLGFAIIGLGQHGFLFETRSEAEDVLSKLRDILTMHDELQAGILTVLVSKAINGGG